MNDCWGFLLCQGEAEIDPNVFLMMTVRIIRISGRNHAGHVSFEQETCVCFFKWYFKPHKLSLYCFAKMDRIQLDFFQKDAILIYCR